MGKLILATLVCAFIASPVLASDFQAERTKMLNKITMTMEQFKDNPNKIDFLNQKKTCVQEATDINGLQGCTTKFHPDQLKAMTNVSQ